MYLNKPNKYISFKINFRKPFHLHYVCNNKFITPDILNILIDKGVDINLQDKKTQTALMYLCKNKKITPELLNILIKNKANVNIQDDVKLTALMYLCQNKSITPKLLEILIENGANVNTQNIIGGIPLNYLCVNESISPELLNIFIKNGVNQNIQTRDGYTPLMLLCMNELITPESLNMLIKAGANLNIQNEKGNTALMYLCNNINITPKLLYELIENGADPYIKNVNLITPFWTLFCYQLIRPELIYVFLINDIKINEIELYNSYCWLYEKPIINDIRCYLNKQFIYCSDFKKHKENYSKLNFDVKEIEEYIDIFNDYTIIKLLWQDENLKDFYILCIDKTKIHVNKFVLFSRSKLFREMFIHSCDGKDLKEIKDYTRKSHASLNLFFKYLYFNKFLKRDYVEIINNYEDLVGCDDYFKIDEDSFYKYELEYIKNNFKI
jgi:ankyrin repeat protein